jgi:hypothetical protein
MSMSSLVTGLRGPGSVLPHLHQVTPNPYLLGVPLVLAALAAAVLLWRHPLTLPLVGVALIGIWVARGWGATLDPEGAILRIPILRNVTETRLAVLFWLAAVVLATLAADRLAGWVRARWGAVAAAGAGAAAMLGCLATPAVADVRYGIVRPQSIAVDTAIPSVITQPGYHRVLTFPAPTVNRGLLDQAVSGDFSYSLSGGTSLQIVNLAGRDAPAEIWLEQLTYGWMNAAPTASQLGQISSLLIGWGTTDVVIPERLAPNIGYSKPYQMIAAMTELLGAPTLIDREWVWTQVDPTVPSAPLITGTWLHCLGVGLTVTAVEVPSCVTESLGPPPTNH